MDADSQQETVRFHRAITGPSNDTYGLIATDSKAQTVAEAAKHVYAAFMRVAAALRFFEEKRQTNVVGE
jgi:hypothetical protein